MWAVSDDLEVAIKETRNVTNTAVTIFTDSSAAMTNIKKSVAKPEGLAVRDLIYQRSNERDIRLHYDGFLAIQR